MKSLKSWRFLARFIGDFQARIILSFFYFAVLGPFAVVIRWWSDPLQIKAGSHRGWYLRSDYNAADMKRAVKQF